MSGDARRKASRKNGFDGNTKEQISSWVVELVMIPLFYIMVFLSIYPTHPTEAICAAAGYSALLAVLFPLWLWLELTDPAAPGGRPCPCFAATRYWNKDACEWQPKSRRGQIAPDFEITKGTKKTNQTIVRYDAATKKRVKGLDHFCKWLNTPVGFRNYPHFFTMVVLCNAQMLYTLVVSIVALAAWGANEYIWAWVMWIAIACGCVVLNYFGFDLFFYHLYLMRRGISTYDDIFEKAQKRTRARKLAAGLKKKENEAGTPESAELLDPKTGEPNESDGGV